MLFIFGALEFSYGFDHAQRITCKGASFQVRSRSQLVLLPYLDVSCHSYSLIDFEPSGMPCLSGESLWPFWETQSSNWFYGSSVKLIIGIATSFLALPLSSFWLCNPWSIMETLVYRYSAPESRSYWQCTYDTLARAVLRHLQRTNRSYTLHFKLGE